MTRDTLHGAWRMAVVVVLGFASGLPLALTGQAMQAWLSQDGLDVATIGLLGLVGLPYTFKFLWAPLMDRFDVPWLGRRRGWLVLAQILLAGALWAMSGTSPHSALNQFALLAVLVAFLSASQDVVIDAYRTDLLPGAERGLGSSFNVLGYRLAMVLSGGVALIWTDPTQWIAGHSGWTWPDVYRFMALLMLGAAVISAVALPRLADIERPRTSARQDLLGFFALLVVVAVGWLASDHYIGPAVRVALGSTMAETTLPAALQQRWLDLVTLVLGLGLTLLLAWQVMRRVRFETLANGLNNYFSVPGAGAFLALIVFYKLGDAFAGSLLTPFLLKGMAFGSAEVGVANKILGLWLTIFGAIAGGALMLRLGLYRSLLLFGVLQTLSNLGFWWLASYGKGVMPGITLPAFDWVVVSLAHPTPLDGGLLMVIAAENITGGMGTAAFVAFLMSLCNQRFTATQFALLSAFASVGRVWVGPLAGVLAATIGWPHFFLVSIVCALPALVMLFALRDRIRALETPRSSAA